MNWRAKARGQVFLGQMNPDYVPRYQVPARRWWQLWKPKWEWVEGVSQNQLRRAHGHPPVAERPVTGTLDDDFFNMFGIQ